jgi:hypothetical protein
VETQINSIDWIGFNGLSIGSSHAVSGRNHRCVPALLAPAKQHPTVAAFKLYLYIYILLYIYISSTFKSNIFIHFLMCIYIYAYSAAQDPPKAKAKAKAKAIPNKPAEDDNSGDGPDGKPAV